MFLGQLDPEAMGANLEHATHYEATPLADFDALMAANPIAVNTATFIDIGSGMGRVVLLAARKAFKQIIGVEFSGALHEIARENLRTYAGRPLNCRDVRLVHADAADFAFPSGNLVVFMYNPFTAPVLKRVLRNLETHAPRDVALIYHTPVHRAAIESTERFDIVAVMKAGVVYRML